MIDTKFRKVFAGMHPLDISEFLLLGMMVVVLPFSWVWTVWLLYVLIANTLLKIIVTRKIGNPNLFGLKSWSVWLMILFYVFNVISLSYSSNTAWGLTTIGRRLPLLAFPLCCFLSDMRWFDSDKRRSLMWLFTLSLIVKFIISAVNVFFIKHSFVYGQSIDTVHHTYLSMYQLFAMGFLYSELVQFWRKGNIKGFVTALVASLFLVAYIVLIFSRTGALGLSIMSLLVVMHQLLIMRNIRIAIYATLISVVFAYSLGSILPEKANRLRTTVVQIINGDMSDIRLSLMQNALCVSVDNMPFGVGVGDVQDTLLDAYQKYGNDMAFRGKLNTHNIFLDVFLAMGLPGLLLLLAVFIVPMVYAYRVRDIAMLFFLFAVIVTGMIEAIFYRQMGLMFVGLFWMISLGSVSRKTEKV